MPPNLRMYNSMPSASTQGNESSAPNDEEIKLTRAMAHSARWPKAKVYKAISEALTQPTGRMTPDRVAHQVCAEDFKKLEHLWREVPGEFGHNVQMGAIASLRRQNVQLVGRISQVKEANAFHRQNMNGLDEVIDEQKKIIKQQGLHLQGQKTLSANLNKSLHARDTEILFLKKALRNRNDRIRSLEKKITSAAVANQFKVSDTAVHDTWHQMAFTIRTICKLLTHRPTTELSTNFKWQLKTTAADWEERLNSDDESDRSGLFEAFLWRQVMKVLCIDNTAWGGHLGGAFRNMKAQLEGAVENKSPEAWTEVSQWLVQGLSLVEKLDLHESDGIELERFAQVISVELRPFMKIDCSSVEEEEAALRPLSEDLLLIAKQASQLDFMFTTSRAIYGLSWNDSRQDDGAVQTYAEDIMTAVAWEDDELSAASKVKLFISPVLVKTGTADGERFGTQICLEKANVICA